MRFWIRWAVGTALALTLWTALVGVGHLYGWGRTTLAPRGDVGAFAQALIREAETRNHGAVSLALLRDGRVFAEHAHSVGAPVDADTAFQVASLSKWVTAWGIMTLVERGRLDLDAPVSRSLSRWSLPDSELGNDGVTTRRLLSHTAGLVDGLGYAGFAPGTPLQSLEASLTRAADADPGNDGAVRVGIPPGSTWRYSGGGYTLLQLLIEEISDQSFEAFMQQAVFEPLGMHGSTFVWEDARGALAPFYDQNGQVSEHRRYTAKAAAGLYTSVSDLTRFLAAHVPGPNGEPVGRGVLSAETLEQMREPHASQLGADIWGLGTILYARNGTGGWVIGHDGNNTPALNSTARIDPATGHGIVVLSSGAPLLATDLAEAWVFWETGNPGLLSILTGAGRAFQVAASGWLVILGVAVFGVIRSRRARSRSRAGLPGPLRG